MTLQWPSTINDVGAYHHTPALPLEVVNMLAIGPGTRCVDATLGDGGHASVILQATAPDGKLLGIDADPQALERARKRLSAFGDRVILVNDNFENMETIVTRHNFRPVLAVLMDLGLSSWQLDAGGRGFSFREGVGLDMRLSPEQSITASDLVNTYSQREVERIISAYGEERQARRIASAIVRHRPIATALQLAEVIASTVPRRGQRIHPATRTFQAIRVFVNRELETLEAALDQAVRALEQGGRLVVIAYHSLDDRLIKTFMRRESQDCICPAGQPECVCGHRARIRLLTKKVIKPSPAEVRQNPRVRSARLRACVALGQA